MKARPARLALGAALCLTLMLATGGARAGDILLGTWSVRLTADPASPHGVGAAGDVNADGKRDLLVSTGNSLYVVFGPVRQGPADLRNLGMNGFEIIGGSYWLSTGAGDVNGDGRTDVLVCCGEANESRAAVVFGKGDSATVDIKQRGSNTIVFASTWKLESSAALGDVNLDGLADVVLKSASGAGFVVFGRRTGGTIDLDAWQDGKDGYRIVGRYFNLVGSAGDVDADGRRDVLVGQSLIWPCSAWVILSRGADTVDLSRLGLQGYRIDCPKFDDSGFMHMWGVTGVGDVNRDGRADAAIAFPDARPEERPSAGGVIWIVFGKPDESPVDLANLGPRGFRIIAGGADYAGISVAPMGDVNGDRRADILIGAPLASYSSRARGGSVYVVYGKAGGAPIDLAQLGPQGYRVDGDSAGLELGGQVAGPGDLNADRRPDALVSAVKGGARLVYSLFPIARTRAATADRSGARLRGTVDARGLSTTYFFEYGLTAVYGSRTSPREAGSGTGPVSVTAFLAARPERLRPGLTYHYRLVATNAFGPTYGQDGVFTVPR